MPRKRTQLFLFQASLILALYFTIAWVVGHWRHAGISWRWNSVEAEVGVYQSEFYLSYNRFTRETNPFEMKLGWMDVGALHGKLYTPVGKGNWDFFGLHHQRESYLEVEFRSYEASMFWVMGLSLAYPGWRIGNRIHRKRVFAMRKRMGMCLKCGYDLRATKERCPECGESGSHPAG